MDFETIKKLIKEDQMIQWRFLLSRSTVGRVTMELVPNVTTKIGSSGEE